MSRPKPGGISMAALMSPLCEPPFEIGVIGERGFFDESSGEPRSSSR